MEVKKEVKLDDRKNSLNLENRKKLTLSGVLEVLSFNDEKILLNTQLGSLIIKGNALKMNKLDVQNGDVVIVGNINSLTYSQSQQKKDTESIIKKLFK